MSRPFSETAAPVLDVLYPRNCAACGQEIAAGTETGLCWDCRADSVTLGPPWCEHCGQVIAGRLDHEFLCADCREDPPAYDSARSLFRYEGGVREAIHALKYRRDFSVIPDLSRMFLAGLNTCYPGTASRVLVPVPLHAARERERGFNQGKELIRYMQKLDKSLMLWTGLRRVRKTGTQTRLSKAARKENVRRAFRVRSAGSVPETVFLLDDVMTTGATLNECAKALKRAGVREVNTLTLARG